MGFAFLGGMILNLMPCVSVLSIKAMSFAKNMVNQSEATYGRRVLYARCCGGIYHSGVVLIALRAGGEAVGGHSSFNNLVDIHCLSVFPMGLSLSGVFEMGSA